MEEKNINNENFSLNKSKMLIRNVAHLFTGLIVVFDVIIKTKLPKN